MRILPVFSFEQRFRLWTTAGTLTVR
jgi:hypothetical protein